MQSLTPHQTHQTPSPKTKVQIKKKVQTLCIKLINVINQEDDDLVTLPSF